jgi:hypothetical protein
MFAQLSPHSVRFDVMFLEVQFPMFIKAAVLSKVLLL